MSKQEIELSKLASTKAFDKVEALAKGSVSIAKGFDEYHRRAAQLGLEHKSLLSIEYNDVEVQCMVLFFIEEFDKVKKKIAALPDADVPKKKKK